MADGEERPRFDVYGTLLVVSFVMTLGAVLVLNYELSTNWKYDVFGGKTTAETWHNTQLRDLSKRYEVPYVEVRQVDIDEWNRINKGSKFPVTDYEWPKEYKLDVYPVDPRVDNLWAKTIPGKSEPDDVQKKALDLKAQLDILAPVEEPKKEPPKTEPPKADEPKKDDTKPPEKADAKPPEKADK
jgi:hypothetical protein